MRQLLKRLKPGIIDGFCIGFIGLVVVQGAVIALAWSRQQPFGESHVGFFLVGLHLGGACLASLWLIWGDYSIAKRYLFALLGIAVWVINLILAIRLAMGGWDTPALTDSSMFMLPALAALFVGAVLRRTSRVRFTNRRFARPSQFTIREMLLTTLFVAFAFAAIPDWITWQDMTVACLAGAVPFVLVVQPPLAISWRLSQVRRYWWYQAIWLFVLLGGSLTIGVYVDAAWSEIALVFALVLGWLVTWVYGVFFLKVCGFEFIDKKKRAGELEAAGESRKPRLLNATAMLASVSLFAILLLLGWNFDVRTLIIDSDLTLAERFALSRRVALVSQSLREFPEQDVSYGLTYEWSHCGADFQDDVYSVSGLVRPQALSRLISGARDKTLAELSLGYATPETAQVFRGFKISSLAVDNAVPFSVTLDICECAKVKSLSILGPVQSVDIQRLTEFDFEELFLGSNVHCDKDSTAALAKLPVSSLDISFNDSSTITKLSSSACATLRISDSEIDNRVVKVLRQSSSLDFVRFSDCHFRPGVMSELVSALFDMSFECSGDSPTFNEIMMLSKNKSRRISFSFTEWLGLGDACPSSHVMLVKLSKARQRYVFEPDEIARMDGEEPLASAVSNGLGIGRALELLAHKIERDASGNVTLLDLEGYGLRTDDFELLSGLAQLRSLRVASPYQTAECWEKLKRLNNLETLEVPARALDNEAVEMIGQLHGLRRLQLPLTFWVDGTLDAMEPEFLDQEELDAAVYFSSYYIDQAHELGTWQCGYETFGSGGYSPEVVMSVDCMSDVGKLKSLEYLYLPGWLVTPETFGAVESMPNLTEFHAAFSNLDAATIQRLGKLQRIESASIGVSSLKPGILAALGRLTSVKKMTLFFFDEDCYAEYMSNGRYESFDEEIERNAETAKRDAARRKALETVEAAMPWCDVKVLFLPQCFPNEDDPGFDVF